MDIKDDKQKVLLLVEDLISMECFKNEDDKIIPFFSDVSLCVKSQEIWGISADEAKVAQILCEILGSMRTYYSGKCQITLHGKAIKTKKLSIENVFYIDNTNIILDNMNVLEELMFLTTKKTKNKFIAKKQEEMLDLLISLGLGYISLTMVSQLYATEKLLLLVLIACFSSADVIILNAVKYNFSQEEIEIFLKIVKYIKSKNKSLVIATMEPKLIGMLCDKTVFLYKGHMSFCGTVKELQQKADKVKFVIRSENVKELIEPLKSILPGWKIKKDNDFLYLFNYSKTEIQPKQFYKLLSDNNIFPDIIKINKGRVENSFTELMEFN